MVAVTPAVEVVARTAVAAAVRIAEPSSRTEVTKFNFNVQYQTRPEFPDGFPFLITLQLCDSRAIELLNFLHS